MTREQMDFVLATGYGRNSLDGLADLQMSELSCHAKGATYLFPDVHTVVDIGGQDVKVIEIENGMMKNFVMNDQVRRRYGALPRRRPACWRSGSQTAATRRPSPPRRSASARPARSSPRARSSRSSPSGPTKCDIIAGIHCSVAGRVSGLCNRVGVRDRVVMTGGVAQNHGIVKALENQLGHEISTSPLTQYNGALGGSALRLSEALKKQP